MMFTEQYMEEMHIPKLVHVKEKLLKIRLVNMEQLIVIKLRLLIMLKMKVIIQMKQL